MKAHQIAPALTSVFAIDHEGQIRLIERGTDGLWGRWQPTGIAASRIVHGGTVVASLGPDHRISALQRTAGGSWVTWERQARELCAVHVPGRGPLILANDGDAVWLAWKASPVSSWNEWEPLMGPVTGIDASVLPGGHPALVGLRQGDVVYRWEDAGHPTWADWKSLGAPAGGATSVRATSLGGGGLVVFAVGGDGRLSHRWQDTPYATWHEWEDLGGTIRDLAVTKAPGGGLAVFVVADDTSVRYRFQHKPFGAWSPWLDLGGAAMAVSAQTSYTDGLEVFALGLDGEVNHKWCERLDWPWTDWTPLDYEASPLRPQPTAPTSRS
jgi:hypothetical protein